MTQAAYLCSLYRMSDSDLVQYTNVTIVKGMDCVEVIEQKSRTKEDPTKVFNNLFGAVMMPVLSTFADEMER